jgi:hypothetical protein
MEGALPSLNQRFTLRPLPLSDRVVNLVWQRAHLPLPVQTFIGNFDLFHSPTSRCRRFAGNRRS